MLFPINRPHSPFKQPEHETPQQDNGMRASYYTSLAQALHASTQLGEKGEGEKD